VGPIAIGPAHGGLYFGMTAFLSSLRDFVPSMAVSPLRDWVGRVDTAVCSVNFESGGYSLPLSLSKRVSAPHGLGGSRDPSTAHARSLHSPTCFAQDDRTLGVGHVFRGVYFPSHLSVTAITAV
jgi:hypothetical protein